MSGPQGGTTIGAGSFDLLTERVLSEDEESGAAEPEFEMQSSGPEFTPQLSSGFEIEEPGFETEASGFELAGPASPEPMLSTPALSVPG